MWRRVALLAVRLLRVAARAGLLALLTQLCWQQWQQYRAELIATITDHETVMFPGLTVCPAYEYNRTAVRAAQDGPLYWFSYPWALADATAGVTVVDAYDRVALPLTEVITGCGHSWEISKFCIPDRQPTADAPVHTGTGIWHLQRTQRGTCYRFQPTHRFKALVLRFGQYNEDFMNRLAGMFRVEVHGDLGPTWRMSMPANRRGSQMINVNFAGQESYYTITPQRRRSINLRRRPCSDTPPTECVRLCIYRVICSLIQCQPPWMTQPEFSYLPPCNATQLTPIGALEVNEMQRVCACPRACVEDILEIKHIEEADHGIEALMPSVLIEFEPEATTVEESLVLGRAELLPAMGGNMGLLLGYSLLSIAGGLSAAAGRLWTCLSGRSRGSPA